MTASELLAWMRRQPTAPDTSWPLCELCAGTSGHVAITDGPDAPALCYPCILRRGRWAADPASLTTDELSTLWGAHEDVAELVRCPAHDAVEWRWIGWVSDRDSVVDPQGALVTVAEALIVARRTEAAGGLL